MVTFILAAIAIGLFASIRILSGNEQGVKGAVIFMAAVSISAAVAGWLIWQLCAVLFGAR